MLADGRRVPPPAQHVELARRLRAAAGRPLLATVRSEVEGGNWRDDGDTDEGRAAILGALLEAGCLDLVDIEADQPSAAALVARARAVACPVVLSRHLTTHTPSLEALVAAFAALREAGADLPKLAVYAQSPEDCLRLMLAARLAGRARASRWRWARVACRAWRRRIRAAWLSFASMGEGSARPAGCGDHR